MIGEEARMLLGFLPNSSPSSSQVKAAYKKKAWETHPDRFPLSERSVAESNFKLISEAYTCLQSASGVRRQVSGRNSWVVGSGVPRGYGGGRNHALIGIPFLFIVLGTLGLGGSSATRGCLVVAGWYRAEWYRGLHGIEALYDIVQNEK